MVSNFYDEQSEGIVGPTEAFGGDVPVVELAVLGRCDFEARVVPEERWTFVSGVEHQLDLQFERQVRLHDEASLTSCGFDRHFLPE